MIGLQRHRISNQFSNRLTSSAATNFYSTDCAAKLSFFQLIYLRLYQDYFLSGRFDPLPDSLLSILSLPSHRREIWRKSSPEFARVHQSSIEFKSHPSSQASREASAPGLFSIYLLSAVSARSRTFCCLFFRRPHTAAKIGVKVRPSSRDFDHFP